MGQPRPWRNTSLAHDSQKRWWPHGTNAMRASRSATRQTSQQSSLTAAVSCAVALALAQTAVYWSKLISHYLRHYIKLRLAFHTSSFPRFPVSCSSRVFQSCIFHPCSMVPRFPVSHFPRLSHGATFSSLAFSVLAFSAPPSYLSKKVVATVCFLHFDTNLSWL